MPDNIEPGSLLVALTLLVAVWLALGIRDRIRTRSIREALARHVRVTPWACGVIWSEGDVWCVCDRRYEHTGPCSDSLHRVIRR